MTKISVKKPFTIFVAVVIILILGFISYTKMTPDLMPNIDMPYALITTTYPGASPEKVESEVTKPLEKSLGTLDNIKNVTSTSNENYSMIALEFEDSVNMDSITVDIMQKINTVEKDFDDTVATPNITKINPNMMPVMIAAIDVDNMNSTELSKFVDKNILSKLEGTEGVVNVTANGLIEQTIDIQVSDEKIEKLNKEISKKLLGEFDDKETELNESEEKIKNGKAQVEEGSKKLQEAQKEFADKMASASGKLDAKEKELLQGKIQLNEQLQKLNEQLVELETAENSLKKLKTTISEVDSQKTYLNNSIKLLSDAQNNYTAVKTAYDTFNTQIESINNNSALTDDQKNEALQKIYNDENYKTTVVSLEKINAVFTAFSTTYENSGEQINQLNSALTEVEKAESSIDSSLNAQGITRDDIDSKLTEISEGKSKIEAGISTLNSNLTKLENGEIKIEEAMNTLETQKISALLEFSSNSSNLAVTSANLDNAKTQIEQGRTSFEEAKNSALDKADLTKLITKDMISKIIMAENFSMPAGYAQSEGEEYTVTVGEEYSDIDDIRSQVLFDMGIDGVEPVTVRDIANVDFSDNSDEFYAKVNKNNGIVISFQKQSNYATADVSNNLHDKFDELEKEYENVHFMTLMDQGDYIYMVTDSLFQSLIFGAIFAVLILFLFLKDIRPTLITLLSIPLSILFTIILMYFSGISINMMSLAGLAVSVGMLVDNSVVVIENIYRLKSKGVSAIKAALSGAKQVTGAIIASTLTTISVFLPIVFVEGMTRQLFTDMSLTIAYSLLASLIIAVTLVPAMGSKILKNSQPKPNKTIEKLTGIYKKSLSKVLNHKVIALSLAVILLVTTCVLSVMKGFIFIPETEMNQISVSLEMPDDAKFEDTKSEADIVLNKILSIDSIEQVGAMASDDKNVAYYAVLKDDAKLSGGETAEKINTLCKNSKGEVSASASGMAASMKMLSGEGISIKIYGDNLDKLRQTSEEMSKILEGVDGITKVDNGIGEVSPALKINIDKNKAMKKGLTVAQVYTEVSNLLKTDVQSTTVSLDENTYSVNITNKDNSYRDIEDIENMSITATDSQGNEKTVKISDIADIVKTDSPMSINRENQKRLITLTASVDGDDNVTLVTDRAVKALKSYEPQSGITYEFDGENEMIMDSIYDLFQMLLIGVALVYLIMVAQFQSLKSPFIVMFTIPLALTGGLGALLICNKEISVVSMMGFVLLCGVIVNNGIVLVDYINQLRLGGMNKREAIIEGGVTRIRPILMTSITTILGLLVMALGIGTGTDLMQPVAIVCIGGLIYATLLTLFIIPIIYDIFNRKELRKIDDKELEYTEE